MTHQGVSNVQNLIRRINTFPSTSSVSHISITPMRETFPPNIYSIKKIDNNLLTQ